jgi:hypothetical protein
LRHYTFKSKDKSFDKGVSAKTSPPTPTKEDSPPLPMKAEVREKTIKETSQRSPVSSAKSEAAAEAGEPPPTHVKKKKKKCIIM